ncbi:hypothetical protein FOA52_002857 [Chlamydomonas sp. UWO 241]|nr:hypothetical protein FOA52_002857 [Chlamydomonas sp. UWO 241]
MAELNDSSVIELGATDDEEVDVAGAVAGPVSSAPPAQGGGSTPAGAGGEQASAANAAVAQSPRASTSTPPEGTATCIICYEPVAKEGEHQVVCLKKCGHIYGFCCIDQWIVQTKSSKCPQCSTKCKRSDVTRLFGFGTVAPGIGSAALEARLAEQDRQRQAAEASALNLAREVADLKRRHAAELARVQEATTQRLAHEQRAQQRAACERSARERMQQQQQQLPGWSGRDYPAPGPPGASGCGSGTGLGGNGPSFGGTVTGFGGAVIPGFSMPWSLPPQAASGPPAAWAAPLSDATNRASLGGAAQQQHTQQQQTVQVQSQAAGMHGTPQHAQHAQRGGPSPAAPLGTSQPGHSGAHPQAQAAGPTWSQSAAPWSLTDDAGGGGWPGKRPRMFEHCGGGVGDGSGGGGSAGPWAQSQFATTQQQPDWRAHPREHQPQQHRQRHEQQQSSRVFDVVQEYATSGTRCFDLHVPSATLLMPITLQLPGSGAGGSGGSWVLQKANFHCPAAPGRIALPGVTCVKDVTYSDHHKLAALATQGAGLLVVSPRSDSIATSYDLGSAVWSVSWGRRNPHHLYAGLQDGRLVRVDIRVSGGPGGRCERAVEQLGRPSPQPLHTVAALGDEAVPRPSSSSYEEEGGGGVSGGAGVVPLWARPHAAGPMGGSTGGDAEGSMDVAAEAGGSDGAGAHLEFECLAAAPGLGVWALPAAAGLGALLPLTPLLPPPRDSRATCESLAVDHASALIAVSWRPPAGTPAPGPAARAGFHAHIDVLQQVGGALWALPPAAAGDPGSLFHCVRTLAGHASGSVLTRGAFVPSSAHLQQGACGQPGQAGWFVSADEARRAPTLWDLGSGALVETLKPHADHVTQLAAGSSPAMGTLLAACSATRVSLHRLAL